MLALCTSWLDSRHQLHVSKRLYLRNVLPIGLLNSGSVVCSNLAYIHLSVPFVQILKVDCWDSFFAPLSNEIQATAPCFTLAIAYIWGQEHLTRSKVLKILVIVSGIVLASLAELRYSTVGIILQLSGIIFESIRAVMIKELMRETGASMDPLVALYYYSPVSATATLFTAYNVELQRNQWPPVTRTMLGVLIFNVLGAFLLNVSNVLLVSKSFTTEFP